MTVPGQEDQTPLRDVLEFGINRGNLRMLVHVPQQLAAKPALVVALHGCGQTADDYDRGTGWSSLANAFGFVAIYPEQRVANNIGTCFSWYLPGDASRDRGEVSSIQEMVAYAIAKYGTDTDRVFVTGLSAGGAMASALLATYPEVYAGGAIIAGLPFGTATSAQAAFSAMLTEQFRSSLELGDLVRAATSHDGPWPTVSVWHGSADRSVNPSNATQIVRQWLNVHRIAGASAKSEKSGRHTRQEWTNLAGATLVEANYITDMSHGVPLKIANDADGYGRIGRNFIDVGVASTLHIARSWGLVCALVGSGRLSSLWSKVPDGCVERACVG
jgi:poly(hydroxyalkanoate) depolymerase family esterase